MIIIFKLTYRINIPVKTKGKNITKSIKNFELLVTLLIVYFKIYQISFVKIQLQKPFGVRLNYFVYYSEFHRYSYFYRNIINSTQLTKNLLHNL
jgi:hypothetical protein